MSTSPISAGVGGVGAGVGGGAFGSGGQTCLNSPSLNSSGPAGQTKIQMSSHLSAMSADYIYRSFGLKRSRPGPDSDYP